MSEKKYQDRSVLDKLGVQPGYAIAFVTNAQEIDPELLQGIIERTGRSPATADEALDIILAMIDETTDAIGLLREWRQHLKPTGGIWLLTQKRGQPGYVDQRDMITAGQQAGVVDNKICSISPTISAMRFVIRKKDRIATGNND